MWRKSIGYEIQEALGEGNQGRVFKALRQDPATGLKETVAIKILHSKTAVELWRREFESLRRVRSRYCVQVFAFERFDGRPALVLEYVDGVSLAKLFLTSALEESLIEEILAQTEAAICDLHGSGLFHGDLSPQNILIDRSGGLRLLDFGFANGGGREARFTPEFAAPERFSFEPASFAADLFSIGRIEQFLGGEPLLPDPQSSYLKLNPKERRLRGLRSQLEPREKLGRLVQDLLERRILAAGLSTRTMQARPIKRKSSWPLAILATLFAFNASSSARMHGRDGHSLLEIRTDKWHYFILDGTPLGYSPVSIALKSERNYRLEWISAAGKGQIDVKAKPEALLRLQDRDFSH